MVFPFSDGFSWKFLWISHVPMKNCDFPMVFLWFSHDCPCVSEELNQENWWSSGSLVTCLGEGWTWGWKGERIYPIKFNVPWVDSHRYIYLCIHIYIYMYTYLYIYMYELIWIIYISSDGCLVALGKEHEDSSVPKPYCWLVMGYCMCLIGI